MKPQMMPMRLPGRLWTAGSGIENQYGQVWVINSDGTGSRQLTEDCNHRNSDDPSWSPDGKKILFSTGRSERNELWVMVADGENERKVSDIDAAPFLGRASWQPATAPLITAPVKVKLNRIPDRAEILFLQDGYYIYAMDRSGGNVTQINFERPRNYEHVAVSFEAASKASSTSCA